MSVSSARTEPTTTRTVPLLLLAPACALVLSLVVYLFLRPMMPSHVARHVGPDGIGYSSTTLIVMIMLAASLVPFLIAWASARGYFQHDHWFAIQKTVVVSFVSLGYGILGVALATILTTVGRSAEDAATTSVAMGMLGFLLLFAASACTYTVLLPRAKTEPLV